MAAAVSEVPAASIFFTRPVAVRTFAAVRRVVLFCLIFCGSIALAVGQEQERKLIDRLLKPDLSLQNPAQEKKFVAGGGTTTKQARTKSFYVADRRAEKEVATGKFRTKEFGTRASRYDRAEANLKSGHAVAKTTVPYSTGDYSGVKPARERDKAACASH